jgi:hypothetical protein
VVLTALTACGGGGGSTPAPVPVIYTAAKACADNSKPTIRLSQADADAKVLGSCPAFAASAYALTAVVVADGTLAPVVKDLPAGTTSGVLTATCPTAGGMWDIDATGKATARSRTSLNWQLSSTGNLAMSFAGAPSVTKTIGCCVGFEIVAQAQAELSSQS